MMSFQNDWSHVSKPYDEAEKDSDALTNWIEIKSREKKGTNSSLLLRRVEIQHGI